jgi:hypothetical protein
LSTRYPSPALKHGVPSAIKMKNNTINALLTITTLASGTVTHADGLIIPLYIDPNASKVAVGRFSDPVSGTLLNAGTEYSGLTIWNIAAEGAIALKNNNSLKYKDYWVIANGPSNGPFQAPLNTTVKAAFDKVRDNGGKIFGYVHTRQAPISPLLVDLGSVKGNVAAWVKAYPSLDGVFIDEFSPLHEVDGTNPHHYSPTDPNPMANGQINPAGGYYYQLTQWIKTTYPQLKIITNPGGRVHSNQYLWNNLGSVVCSYENTLENAKGNGNWYAPQQPWGNLARETTFTTVPQCALIHSNTTHLTEAIQQAKRYGYQYVFTTQASMADNTWGIMPAYFSSEVQHAATRANVELTVDTPFAAPKIVAEASTVANGRTVMADIKPTGQSMAVAENQASLLAENGAPDKKLQSRLIIVTHQHCYALPLDIGNPYIDQLSFFGSGPRLTNIEFANYNAAIINDNVILTPIASPAATVSPGLIKNRPLK